MKKLIRKIKRLSSVKKLIYISIIFFIFIAFIVILDVKNKSKEEEEIKNNVTIEFDKGWNISSDIISLASNPTLFDVFHNCVGFHSISDKIPDGDFIVMGLCNENNSEVMIDHYQALTYPSYSVPQFGNGCVLINLDKQSEEGMSQWRESNPADISEKLDENTYYFYILDPSEYDFTKFKIVGSNISFNFSYSGKEYGEFKNLPAKPLQNFSYMSRYKEIFGYPYEWIKIGNQNGKDWLSYSLEHEDLYSNMNPFETIICPKKDYYEEYKKCLESKNNEELENFYNLEDKNFKCFCDLSILDEYYHLGGNPIATDFSEINEGLDMMDCVSFEECKEFTKNYAYYNYEIYDELR